MKTIELNIFTNCTASAPDTEIIERTFKSFCNTFGKIYTRCFVDRNPNVTCFGDYRKRLENLFDEVIDSKCLSDGYIKSIYESEADYLFQLEHDWIFLDNINHSLDGILNFMSDKNIYHLRFNKRENTVKAWDKYLEEKNYKGFDYCITPQLSNNPHIIDRVQYLEIGQRIEIKPGSKGIEEKLSWKDLRGVIYGPLNYPATIKHLDGRKS